jgi:RNA polymerase sigma-70 factor (ECF subfamily)
VTKTPESIAPAIAPAIAEAFAAHREVVWGLAYRMTGSAADADEVTQETFVRAIELPPGDLSRSLRSWLLKVASNLSIDALRRRQTRAYVGPWLPTPLEARSELDAETAPSARIDRFESIASAFLRALETLSAKERAVLILRDVYDQSVVETATSLALSESNVKVIHHRARKKIERPAAASSHEELAAKTKSALERFMFALASDDADAMKSLLTEDAILLNDSGGAHAAAIKPIRGPAKIAKFLFASRVRPEPPLAVEIRDVNGLPAIVSTQIPKIVRAASYSVCQLELASDGRITAITLVLAPEKLRGIRFVPVEDLER